MTAVHSFLLFCVFTWYRHGKFKFLMTNFFPIGLIYEFSCDRKVKGQDMLVFFNSVLVLDRKRKSRNPVILNSLIALGLCLTRCYEKVYNEHITFPHMCHLVHCDLHCSFVVDSTSCT